MKVFILSVDHKHGTNMSAHRTEARAKAALVSYIAQWWNQETGRPDSERPADDDALISQYFEGIEYRESYAIEESILD